MKKNIYFTKILKHIKNIKKIYPLLQVGSKSSPLNITRLSVQSYNIIKNEKTLRLYNREPDPDFFGGDTKPDLAK